MPTLRVPPWARVGHIFKSRWGWRIFLGSFVIVALPLLGVSLLSWELTHALQQRATQRLMAEATKAATLNLFDRLRSAERLLRAQAQARAAGQPNPALEAQAAAVFDRVVLPGGPVPDALATLTLEDDPNGRRLVPRLRLPAAGGGVIDGVLKADYLLENLASGAHDICLRSPAMNSAYCLMPLAGYDLAQSHTRPLHFMPYFEGPSWTLTAAPDRQAYRFLPFGAGAMLAQATGLAFLLALMASSFYARRITLPLEALIGATRTVRAGDFGQRIDASAMTDEFRELAESFNGMVGEIGADLAFSQLLAQMDAAILARQPLADIMQLALRHLTGGMPGPQVTLRATPPHNAPQPQEAVEFALGADGLLEHRPPRPPPAGFTGQDIAVADRPARRLTLHVQQPAAAPPWPVRLHHELQALAARLAVAVHADEREQQLIARATVDSLTGLLNRLGMTDAIDQAIARARTAPAPVAAPDDGAPGFALVFLDLDGFKDVNDAYGHATGDRLLQQVAYRLQAALAAQDVALARLGGDEFVLLFGAAGLPRLGADLQAVLAALRQPFRIDALEILVGASLGVARHPAHGGDAETLLKNADAAMYAAKAGGRNRIVEYTATLNEATAERLELRRDLVGALAGDQLFLVFQPRVRAADGQVESAEVLLRWRHPQRGLVPPDRFIPLAEETGLIADIGLWVLRESLRQMRAWRATGQAPLAKLSVNLSPQQLAHRDFLAQVEALAAEFAPPHGSVELEITEGAFFRDMAGSVQKLHRLRALGFDIALDDFGVGYSAMSYLSTLPFDTLKIDRSFVGALGQQAAAYAIASAIVALAKALDKRIVAEGVETEAQAQVLRALGVQELQGYLYSGPVAQDALAPRLEQLAARRQAGTPSPGA